METARFLKYLVTFQPLYICALSAISLVGTPLVQTRSWNAARKSASLLPLYFYTSVIFEFCPTKIWALVSPPFIAGTFPKIWLVALASFCRWRLRAGFGDLNCCWRWDNVLIWWFHHHDSCPILLEILVFSSSWLSVGHIPIQRATLDCLERKGCFHKETTFHWNEPF